MYLGIEIMQLKIVGFAVLSSAESSKILAGLGGQIIEELKNDPTCCRGSNLDIHIDLVVRLRTHFYNRL